LILCGVNSNRGRILVYPKLLKPKPQTLDIAGVRIERRRQSQIPSPIIPLPSGEGTHYKGEQGERSKTIPDHNFVSFVYSVVVYS